MANSRSNSTQNRSSLDSISYNNLSLILRLKLKTVKWRFTILKEFSQKCMTTIPPVFIYCLLYFFVVYMAEAIFERFFSILSPKWSTQVDRNGNPLIIQNFRFYTNQVIRTSRHNPVPWIGQRRSQVAGDRNVLCSKIAHLALFVFHVKPSEIEV